MIKESTGKERVVCPHCLAFIAEVWPRVESGQAIVLKCPQCKQEVRVEVREG